MAPGRLQCWSSVELSGEGRHRAVVNSTKRAQKRAPIRRSRRRRILIGAGIAVLIVVMVALLTAYVGQRALAAEQDLDRAKEQLRVLRSAVGDPDQDLPALYASLRTSTTSAVDETHHPVWSAYEHLPWLGPNLTAVRQTVEAVDALDRDGIGPLATAANGLSADSLIPHDGRLDIAPLTELALTAVAVDDALRAASSSVEAIDTSDVLPEVRSAVDDLQIQLAEITPVAGQARSILPLLYPLLGGEGTRHYLLMFQNNAEERASGGNPASLAMLEVTNGKIRLGRQASSADFPHPYKKAPYVPHGKGNSDWDKIYTERSIKFLANVTMTPDFPTTAKMASAMWRDRFGGEVDGVISFDPVALSYLMEAVGPITLADGTLLTTENAVPYLLSEVYARYPDGETQDKVFASAAETIFSAVTDGKGDPQAYLAQLEPAVAEQRLKVWSARSEEQSLLLTTPVATMLPADNDRATVLGVFNKADSTSKMSYYMDERIKLSTNSCGAAPTYTVTATVVNTLSEDQVDALPEYVRAHQRFIPPGGDRQLVQVYGPVGGTLESVTIDAEPVVWGTSANHQKNTVADATGAGIRRPAAQGRMYGRPVGTVPITIPVASSRTVTAVFTGSPEDSATVQVSHTPKVRAVPVTSTSATCR